jgi:chromosome segregation ATPase
MPVGYCALQDCLDGVLHEIMETAYTGLTSKGNAMAENIESIVLEHLRAIRGDIGNIKADVSEIKLRLSSIEMSVGNIHTDIAILHSRADRLDARVERIEKRLELTIA